MDLYEFQAKALFAAHGVPVELGEVVAEPADAARVAGRMGGPVVVKAQVKTGGRGKAGGVTLARTPEEAAAAARAILGMDIKGHVVRRVLIDPAVAIAAEYYVSFLLDRASRSFLAMASAQGGMDIETLAAEQPAALARVPIDAIDGVGPDMARRILIEASFPADVIDGAVPVLVALWQVMVAEDALLVEVNPLARLADGRVAALDGKVTLDDNAAFRQPAHAALADAQDQNPLEARARAQHLNYVKLDGQVGVIGNGAGLVMSTVDVVAHAGDAFGGVRAANFLDIGGGASAQVMGAGLEIVLSDPDVRSVFVNVFGGITACDAVANGIIDAFALLAGRGDPVAKPVVVRLDGNNAAEGARLLREADLPGVALVDSMDGAARRAAQLASSAGA